MNYPKVLITGGAGFIGSNLAARLLANGAHVTLYDNLSRPGAATNLAWVSKIAGSERLSFIQSDVRDAHELVLAAKEVDQIYHLAGQVAVTSSVLDPRGDFEDNALGTFNALEAARLSENNPIFLYSSTNKVYGKMDDVEIIEKGNRYEYKTLTGGVPETQPLDFHSPYGCSKGAGDQYVRDYARIYGLRTIVMRQSCIYGYRQFGVEDQGWVAWFMIAALKGREITIYGDGKQVRDVLFIDDLLNAYELAVKRIETTAGRVYNLGGGPEHTMSVWGEFGEILEELLGRRIEVRYADWRPGDQPVYISNISRARNDFGWSPNMGVKEGVITLFRWMQPNMHLFDHL